MLLKINKKNISVALFLMLIISLIILSVNMKAGKFVSEAAVLRGDPNQTVFGAEPEDWVIDGDAEYFNDETGLLINMPKDYQPVVTYTKDKIPKPGIGDGMTFEIVVDFEVRDRGLGGRFGIGLGMLASTGHIYSSGALFDIGVNGDLYYRKNNITRSQSTLTTNAEFSGSFTGGLQGRKLTMKLAGTQQDGKDTFDVDVYIKQQSSETFFKYMKTGAAADAPTASDVFCDGYLSIMSISQTPGRADDGLLVFVRSFGFEAAAGSDTLVEYYTDFSGDADNPNKDVISYPSARNDANDWRLSASGSQSPEHAYRMGKIGKVLFDKSTDGKMVSKAPIYIDSRSDKIIDMQFTVKVNALTDGAYFGLGFGLDSTEARLDQSNMIYIKRTGNTIYTGILKNGIEHDNTPLTTTTAGNTVNLLANLNNANTFGLIYKVYYDTLNKEFCVAKHIILGSPAAVNAIDPIKVYRGIKIDGHYGIGALSLQDGSVSAELYSAKSFQYEYFLSKADDVSTNFLGTQMQYEDGISYETPFFKTTNWFIAGDSYGVFTPRMMQSGAVNKYLEFSVLPVTSSPLTAFGPKGLYGDFILRYSISGANITNINSYIGISFGRQTIEAPLTAAPLITFTNKNGSMNVSWNSLLKSSDGSADFSDSQVNFFESSGKTYDIMLIGQNGIATLYYCDAENPDYTPRAAFTDVNTSGFIALTGDSRNGYSYKVSKISVSKYDYYDRILSDTRAATNLTDVYKDDIVQVDFSTSYINPTRFSIGNGIVIQNEQLRFAATSKNARFETKGKFDNFTLSFDLTQKFQSTDIVIGFGRNADNPYGYSIKFLAGTNMVELQGLVTSESSIISSLPINIYELSGTVNIKLVALNNEVGLYLKRSNEPATQLNVPVAVFGYIPVYSQAKGTVSLATSQNGNMTIDNFRVRSLNFGIDILTANYGETGKPEITNLDAPPAPGPVQSISLDKSAATMNVGETIKLTAVILPTDAVNQKFMWCVSNKNVATIDAQGNLTAHAWGTITVTVTTDDGQKTAVCTITVKGQGCNAVTDSGGSFILLGLVCIIIARAIITANKREKRRLAER